MRLTRKTLYPIALALLPMLLAGCGVGEPVAEAIGLQSSAGTEKFRTAASLLAHDRYRIACEAPPAAPAAPAATGGQPVSETGQDRGSWVLLAPLEVDRERSQSFTFTAEQIKTVKPGATINPQGLILARSRIRTPGGNSPVYCLFALEGDKLRFLSRCQWGQERACLDRAYATSG